MNFHVAEVALHMALGLWVEVCLCVQFTIWIKGGPYRESPSLSLTRMFFPPQTWWMLRPPALPGCCVPCDKKYTFKKRSIVCFALLLFLTD